MTRFIRADSSLRPVEMRIHDFGRIRGSRIKISDRIGQPLGLVDGSQAFSAMFKYELNGKGSYEIVLSTFGPENYREICMVTFYMQDAPGACAQVAKFLGERNIDILNSASLSMISNVCMVWKMLVDLSYYGDSAALREEFDALKKQRSSILQKAEAMEVEASNISERYARGILPLGSAVKARSVKKMQKSASIIRSGEFEIPPEYMQALEGVKDGDPLMMVADQDSWVLSVTPLNPEAKLVNIEFRIPDKPGAIFEISRFMADANINLLSVSTKVLVYYETMQLSLVADLSSSAEDAASLQRKTEEHLAKLKGKFALVRIAPIDL